ncbi:MAG: 2OG-Fe(II) oxygenase family protein, partial [Acidimicrobiales bacterium]
MERKRLLLRTKENSRGYYDRELTKNARDLKEVLDLAHVPRPELADDDPRNHHAVDGVNQWPHLDGFRSTMIEYLEACEQLSLRLLSVFCVGMGEGPDRLHRHFGPDHTSFVRLNHYPLRDPLAADEAETVTPLGDMALHHHSDAGALTLLLQDRVGGLQVGHGDGWLDVEPVDGALVVNTGDMMQVWSNDRYRAALHRVTPMTGRARSSLPYFFNPSYGTDYAPLPSAIEAGDRPHYRPINWGAFRQARADGDYADYGAEVQITDFLIEG